MEQQLRRDPITGIYSYVDAEEPVKEVSEVKPVKEIPKVVKPAKKK